MLGLMKRGSVVVDVAIDQGGCLETSRPTTYAEPTFVVDDVVHYCVANMPGAVPVTSSAALNNAPLPYVLTTARGGLRALLSDQAPHAEPNVHRAQIGTPACREHVSHFDALHVAR